MTDSYLEGLYGKPRVDTAIINKHVNPKDVILTSACYGGIIKKYGEGILDEFKDFIDAGSFFLEVHPHNSKEQKEYNKEIMDIHYRTGIPIVVANDTHAIDEKYSHIRKEFIKTKGIVYDEESGGWYVDFPSYEELVYRMKIQGVLTEDEIHESIENTFVIDNMIEEFDILEYSLKVPILKNMQHMTEKERYQELEKIIYKKLDEYIKKENILETQAYYDGIAYELKEIKDCHMADYFLFNYQLVKLAIEKYGGVLTKTSRGSASCYITNFLLGLTAMDKYVFDKLPLFSDRFMTSIRILESKTPPDIDYNVAEQEPFVKAMRELLGEENVYPYVALGLYKVKNIEPSVANTVSKAIDEYEKAMKYADEFDDIYVEDFIPEEHIDVFNQSKDMRSIIDTIKPHPCGYINSPHEVKSSIGLITVGKDGDRKPCVCIDGSSAESLGYLKSDILVVSVVDIINKICKEAGIEQPSPKDLLEKANSNPKIWEIYTSGRTFEVNQMTSPRTIKYLKELQPRNIYDLSTTVAAIRPGAMSVVDRIMKRKPYSYDIKELDDILSSHTGSTPAIIYQESIMKLFELAGIPTAEGITLVKAISKKKEDFISSYEEKVKQGLCERFDVDRNAHAIDELWTQIKDSGRYAFNSPHSLATALDSLYMAWLKVEHFDETYRVLLEYYTLGKKRDIAKVGACKREIATYDMTVYPIKIGQDNRRFKRVDDGFTQSIMALKSSNEQLGELLLEINPTTHLMDAYVHIKSKKNPETNRLYCTRRHWKALCKIEYFDTNNKKAEIAIPELHDKVYTKKQFRLSSLEKLFKEIGVEYFDIMPYCTRKTPKTFYLDESKKKDLVDILYEKMSIGEYSTIEKIRNEIDVYGFISNADYYKSFNIFTAQINAISRKNNSVLLETMSGKEVWIKVVGSTDEMKKGKSIIVIKVANRPFKGRLVPAILEYIVY